MILQAKEQELLRSKLDRKIKPMLILESESLVDTGGWLGKRKIRIIVTSAELFLVALGKRPLLENVKLEDCTESRYTPSSGKIILAPATSLRNNELSIPPVEAIKLLKAVGVTETTGTTIPSEHKNDGANALPFLPDSTGNGHEDF